MGEVCSRLSKSRGEDHLLHKKSIRPFRPALEQSKDPLRVKKAFNFIWDCKQTLLGSFARISVHLFSV